MTGLWLSLLRLLTRLALALAIALPIALLLGVVRSGTAFREDLGIGCLLVGCLFLLLAPAGSSPAMRVGTIDMWTASFFPSLLPGMMEEYSGSTLGMSAVFAITGIVMLAFGAILVG